jgi:peptide/nickel transport system substrate-binding protein
MDVGQRGVLEPVNALIQQDLKKVGVIADLNTMEWNSYIQKDVVRRDYTATVNWWTYPSDPDVFPYYHSSAAGKGFNIPGYQDPKLDDLLVQGQTASDLESRKAVYKQLQAYTSETLPYLFLWYPQEVDVLSSSLKGVPELGLRDAVQYIGEWWLAKK